jgi:hypothetical protein
VAGGAPAFAQGDAGQEVTTTFVRFVTPKYLETMGIKLRDGRMFTEADRSSAGVAGDHRMNRS